MTPTVTKTKPIEPIPYEDLTPNVIYDIPNVWQKEGEAEDRCVLASTGQLDEQKELVVLATAYQSGVNCVHAIQTIQDSLHACVLVGVKYYKHIADTPQKMYIEHHPYKKDFPVVYVKDEFIN